MNNNACTYDIIIIGAGPGGYVAAIRAAQLGMRVAILDKRARPGGTCLNVGCIPSKSLLHTSYKYWMARHRFKNMGIEMDGVRLNVPQMMAQKDHMVTSLTQGIDYLFKKNKITFLHGTGSLHNDEGRMRVKYVQGEDTQYLDAEHIVLATGSFPTVLPQLPFDEEYILSSTQALALQACPKHLVVVGGGYIGLEMGCMWRQLGAEVTILEAGDGIAPAMDQDISRQLQKSLSAKKVAFYTQTKASDYTIENDQVVLRLESSQEDRPKTLTCDKVLVSVGRSPCVDVRHLNSVGIETDARGFIKVDGQFQTTQKGVYALGDAIGGVMLAHKAEEEGVALVEGIALGFGHVNYNIIPAIIFTQPEAASVGMTEAEARAEASKEGFEVRIGTFPFMANSLGKAIHEMEGFVKIIARKDTDRVLGVHIIGAQAGAMIAEAAAVMAFSGTSEDIARTCHAHPTMSEAMKEAAWATFSTSPLHM